MKNSILYSLFILFFIVIIVSCGKETTTGCGDGNFIGAFEGSHRINIGPVDLATIGAVDPINDNLLNSQLSGNNIGISSTLLDLTITGNLNTVSNNVLTIDSVRFVGVDDTIEIATDLAPGGLLKLWDLRVGGTVKLDCNTLTTDLLVKSARTNFTNPLDTFSNLINLSGKNVRLVGTFIRK